MKLRDAKLCKLQVNEKNSSTHTPSCILPSFSHDYFFQRGFESVKAQFLSGNINGKLCYLWTSRPELLYKKGVLRDPAQVFSCEFCKISKKTFSYRRLPVAASVICNIPVQLRFIQVNFLHAEYGIWRSLEYSFCQIN